MDRPLRIAELDHVVLRCRDQPGMVDFYQRVLGCAEERRIEPIGLIQLRAGRSLIDLIPELEPERRGAPNVDHVCLGVAMTDMGAVMAYLRAEQVDILGEPGERYGAHGMGLSLYVLDPEGNIVELKQLPSAE
jgi:glyoxylase I family protein